MQHSALRLLHIVRKTMHVSAYVRSLERSTVLQT